MRLLGITIPEQKRLEYGLTEIYGIGHTRAREILDEANVDRGARPGGLSTEEENRIRKVVEGMTLEGDLRRLISANIKRLKDIKSYRGSRHAHNLPARGQRTQTNSRTVRGNIRKTMGSGKTKVEKK